MPIRFSCPSCGKTLKVGDQHAGKKSKCPGCGKPIVIPQSSPDEPTTVVRQPAATPPAAPPPAPAPAKSEPTTPKTIPSAPTAPEAATAQGKQRGGKKRILWIVLALLLALAGTAGYFWYAEGYIPFFMEKIGN